MWRCLRFIKLAVFAGFLGLGVAACGGEAESASSGGPVTEADAAEIYGASCATCHGNDGGGFVGPPLTGVHDRLSAEEISAVIANGRVGEAGAMPAWSDRYSPEEIAAVTEYLRTFG